MTVKGLIIVILILAVLSAVVGALVSSIDADPWDWDLDERDEYEEDDDG